MIRLKFCSVGWRDDGAVWTTFDDGTECPATSHDTHHYHVIAHRLGYGDDIAAYTAEHEFFHSFVSEWFYDKPSPVLWAIAHGKMLPGKEAVWEEIAAQTAQRWIRANERPIVGGTNWDAFKARALQLLDSGLSEFDLAQERMARQFEIDRGLDVRPDPNARLMKNAIAA